MMRSGFSMMMAITVIVVMMGVSAMVFSLSNKIVYATTTQYHKEQAILLAKSYTEYTLMAITANRGTLSGTNCLDGVTGRVEGLLLGQPAKGSVEGGMGYEVTTRVSYIGNKVTGEVLECSNTLNSAPVELRPDDELSPSPNVIIDVYVRYRDTSMHLQTGNSPWMHYHRRTIQKI